ncbi:hypothetical protein [Mycolicibacterium duvalii]|uniref:4Fe-4S Wbl-type domain-containing protein n=2 Tax=Mycolicibacterium duvalii TaxID=39688 RepID=A0A7I7K0B6_9MYCO|nr:hypothetical protein [Mycolicibacterium duvalii]BBX16959.1 hypothetical protein MDUV_18190 [Mycolicibacterium duvalii]
MCCSHYKRFLKTRPPGAAKPRDKTADTDTTNPGRISLADFLAALAAAVPPLRGARCRGHAELFDATIVGRRGHHAETQQARAAAVSVCAACPALDACRGWLDQLPTDARPLGVVAGRVITSRRVTA